MLRKMIEYPTSYSISFSKEELDSLLLALQNETGNSLPYRHLLKEHVDTVDSLLKRVL